MAGILPLCISFIIDILFGIWNVHFACEDKMNQIEAQNTAGAVPPASICNEDMIHFSSMEVDNSISEQYMRCELKCLHHTTPIDRT